MARMTREELNAVAAEAVLVLPIGATEQHGPHLGTGTDHLVVTAVAAQAAAALGDDVPLVVAPTLAFGHSHHHLPFGGTLSVTPATYQRLLVELGTSAAASGFGRLFVLNGHGGNVEIAAVAAREIARLAGIPVGSGSYWTMAWDALQAEAAERGILLPGHAGSFETSVMLALHPDHVAEDRPHRDAGSGVPFGAAGAGGGAYLAAVPGSWEAMDGWSDSPAAADAGAGRRFLELTVEAVAAHLRDFVAQTA